MNIRIQCQCDRYCMNPLFHFLAFSFGDPSSFTPKIFDKDLSKHINLQSHISHVAKNESRAKFRETNRK